jgi:hypothetical protein
MELILQRRWAVQESTLGELFVEEERLCYTLEDVVREGDIFQVKVAGKTAIPAGRYRVVIDRSERFSRLASAKAGHPVDVLLPRLLEVPAFSGIRIHAGNRAEDTEGCILVGDAIGDVEGDGPDDVVRSAIALRAVMQRIQGTLDQGELCHLTITNAFGRMVPDPT